MLNNSSRIGRSLSHGDAFRENPRKPRIAIAGLAVNSRFDNYRVSRGARAAEEVASRNPAL